MSPTLKRPQTPSPPNKLYDRALKHILSEDDSERSFNSLALEIFHFQFEKNAHYRKYCLISGASASSVLSWKQIPAMPAQGFKELVLSAFPVKKAVRVFQTSGTTRGGAKGAHFFETLKLYDAAILPSFKKYILPDRAKLDYFFLTHSPAEAPHSSLCYMMGTVNKKLARGKGRFYVKADEVLNEKLFKDLKAGRRPVILLGTVFSLAAFLNYLKAERLSLRLPPGSRLMETGGFKGRMAEISKTKLYGDCEKYLGVPADHCVSEYGMTELSSQFYDTTLRDLIQGNRRRPFKAGPPWMKFLIIDPRTNREALKGQKGVLRIFDLANAGSVMAVQTEDLARQTGDGFELLGRAPRVELRGCSLSYEKFITAS